MQVTSRIPGVRRGSSPWVWVLARQIWKSFDPQLTAGQLTFTRMTGEYKQVGSKEGNLTMALSPRARQYVSLSHWCFPHPRVVGKLFVPVRTVKWHCWHLGPSLFPGLSSHPLSCLPFPSWVLNMYISVFYLGCTHKVIQYFLILLILPHVFKN